MIRLLHVIFFLCFVAIACAGAVNETEFNTVNVCGDGKWDGYYEQCDSTPGCTKSCLCDLGYTPDPETGLCKMSCIYGDACETGCLKPDTCEICNVDKGYAADCQGCKDGYMWFGEGNCKEMPLNTTFLSCGLFFKELWNNSAVSEKERNNFNLVIGSDQFDKEGKVSIPLLPDNIKSRLQVTRCSRLVEPTKPYTYGVWIRIQSDKKQYVSIELDKKYSREELILASTQQKKVGNSRGMVVQEECPSTIDISQSVYCVYRNGGYSKYVQSPRIVTSMEAGAIQYIFVHSKYAAEEVGSFDIFINPIVHACSSSYSDVEWNEMASSSFTTSLNLQYSILSTSVCSIDLVKGFWFKIPGADETLEFSTCNSASEYDINLDLLRVKLESYEGLNTTTTDFTMVNCDDASKAECVRTRTDGCSSTSRLARMVASLSHEYVYFLFVGINEEYSATIQLDIKTTCPQNCGSNGICSAYSGKCECLEGFVLKDSVCTKCGNGVLDENEDCDLSVPGYIDPKCDSTCNCKFGHEPKSIGGVTKCAVPTCDNKQMDEYEQCDGGFGCDHCVCVNGTKKYAKARFDCMLATCGNKKWDKGEECDGGDGCVECECQPDWFSQNQADCTRLSYSLRNFLFWGIGCIAYLLLYLLLLFLIVILYIKLTGKIKKELDDEKLVIFENTIIPFDKTNSQYIDLRQENPYFTFSSNNIDFGDTRPEINEPVTTDITLTNNWKENMHFTFHSGDFVKYEIMCKPFTGTIKPKEQVKLSITFMAKCTTILNEKVPITLRYGQLQNIMKDIKKENPNLIAHASQSSQNSESDNKSKSSGAGSNKNSHPSHPSNNPSNPSKSTPSGSGKSDSDDSKKKKKGKSKVSKFHVYLNLQVESALSTKLDYEEIHLQHPPIGGGTFGIVYRAEWRRVDVAVKVMKTDLVGLAELLPNFMQEAEMMERIRCPYIVNFIGSVVTTDTLCLVTEFCPLASLRKFMKVNAMTDLLKVRFCQDIAKGMEYLHHNDILHRDLKTDNVLVYSKNPHDPITAKVTDFGTSRSFIESSGKIELQNIGTPVYMAPEINKKDQMTLKSDVYSFAICMLEIWLGRDPYDPAKFPDSESILRFVGASKRLEIADDCLFKNIIQQSWKNKPTERPTFKEIGTALDSIQKKLNDASKSDSKKDHSGSTGTGTNTKDKSVSSSEKKNTQENTDNTNTNTNTNTQEESIEASVSSQVAGDEE
ncbi:serine-threonine protein kinase, putative [Entamoeba invadens IP1]|uniref:Serine-threonine protein kinase, putative n=1 Tax=Entamoeba invadens IP1 TaxID=370355 RepID=A0A0A1UBY5_ENTIV|nr:serine-threonine protein kinase, putative [Entamoeba invadens IP1]ELP92663.1 serine-threonine protein kinase, putative [Entamoeba invadens IP1]|eukprot:XP_004259434.1 serine-threonine protein kinase, putative [Entamoeba invadens IP1]